MNVWRHGWCPMTHPSSWIRNIKNVWRCIKWSWQRVVKGYCDYDVFDLDTFYCNLFYLTMKDLSELSIGYPYDMRSQEWTAYLLDMARCFYRANESNKYYVNEYDDPLFNDIDGRPPRYKDAIRQQWFEREKDLSICRTMDLDRGLDMLKERFNNLFW